MRLDDKSQHFQSSGDVETEKVKSRAETIMPTAGNEAHPSTLHWQRHEELPFPAPSRSNRTLASPFWGCRRGDLVKSLDFHCLKDPIAETPHMFAGHREINLGTDWETSSLVASFHSSRGCYANFWGKKINDGLTQCWTLNAIIPNCQERFAHWCKNTMWNQPFSYWIWGLQHRKESLPCTENLIKSLWIGRS